MMLARMPDSAPKELQLDTDARLKVTAGPLATVVANIANGASLTLALDLGSGRAARIAMPALWTVADLTFQTSYDGVAFADLYDAYGTEYTVKAGAARAILLPPADFLGIRWLKIRSGTGAVPVNQAASRDLVIQTAP